MDDEELQTVQVRGLEEYWDLFKRRWWWVLGLGFAFWAIALAGSYTITPGYKSETTILVDQPRIPQQYVTPNVAIELQSRLRSLSEQILSRTRLLRIIQDYQLYSSERKRDEHAAVARMRSDIEIELIKSAKPDELSAFKISYTAPKPKLAQEITDRLTSFFIQENLRNQQRLSQDTTNFMEAQVEDARKDLEKQEVALKQFRSQYLGQLPEQTQSNMQILSGLQARLDGANEGLNHAEQQKLYIGSLLNEYKATRNATPGGSTPGTEQAIDQRLEKLKSELLTANSQYTPLHPDVIRLKQKIADVEELKRRMGTSQKDLNAGTGDTSNVGVGAPMMQLLSEAKANELEIANRRKEVQALERQIEQYQARLNIAPLREQQLAALTRNYNQLRSNYESVLSKKMQSQMATNLEERQQGEQFRVLDPPSLPQRPYKPKRLMMALGGLAGGIFLGIAGILAVEFADPRIYGCADLAGVTGAPVLAIVPPLPTPRELHADARRRVLQWTAAAIILATIPSVTLLTYMAG
jgi:polysaccharide chain length determinant protein (PEP-CTERM system associated)